MRARTVIELNTGWRFLPDPYDKGVAEGWPIAGLPGGHEINVPHTWNVEDGLEDYRGVGWYEYRFEADKQWEGLTVRTLFEAVYRDAEIWLNGQPVGSHRGSGYTAFTIDMTSKLLPGQSNLLMVSVDNRNSEQALPHGNSFDWADDGGLIRGVSMIVSGKSYIDYAKIDAAPLFEEDSETDGSGGANGATDKLYTTAKGLIRGEVYLQGFSAGQKATLSIEAWREQNFAGKWRQEVQITGDHGAVQLQPIQLDQVDLWHFDHPHLYKLVLTVVGEEDLYDQIETTIGFREIVADGSRLLLNREPVRLIGVEWMPGSNPELGMAETGEDLFRSLHQIKEANCVITRFHWQQDERLLDWCDRNGLLVQEEIPHWQQPAVPGQSLLPLALQHAEEMVNRHYNHPSVFAWGMGNEIDGQHPDTMAYVKELKREMLKLDPGRLLNYVSNTVHLNPERDATSAGDAIMWNDYIGTWHGDLDRPATIRAIAGANPGKPLIVAEYGLCEPAFEGGDDRRGEILVSNNDEYRKHSEIAVVIYFSLNDYRTQMGEEGEGRLRRRVHGSTDLYGEPKPSYDLLRDQAAPLKIEGVQAIDDGKVEVLLTAADNLPSYAVRGYSLSIAGADGGPAADGAGTGTAVAIPELKPGQSCRILIDDLLSEHAERKMVIRRPTGFTVLEERVTLDPKP